MSLGEGDNCRYRLWLWDGDEGRFVEEDALLPAPDGRGGICCPVSDPETATVTGCRQDRPGTGRRISSSGRTVL